MDDKGIKNLTAITAAVPETAWQYQEVTASNFDECLAMYAPDPIDLGARVWNTNHQGAMAVLADGVRGWLQLECYGTKSGKFDGTILTLDEDGSKYDLDGVRMAQFNMLLSGNYAAILNELVRQ